MKLIELWRAKLKSAKIQRHIAQKQLNAAQRAVDQLNLTIYDLENKLERYMAKPKSKATKHD